MLMSNTADNETNMAVSGMNFLLIFSLFVICVVGDGVKTLPDTHACDNHCHLTYAAHTSIQVEEPGSCSRGCRFYAISYMLRDGHAADYPHTQCRESCSEAYSGEGAVLHNLVACHDGCDHQHIDKVVDRPVMLDPRQAFLAAVASAFRQSNGAVNGPEIAIDDPTKGNSDAGEDQEEDSSKWSFARPVMRVRKVVAQVMGSFHILRTSVMTYFLQDDNSLVAVQSDPQIMVEIVPPQGLHTPEDVVKPAEGKPANRDDELENRLNTLKNGVTFGNLEFSSHSEHIGVQRVPLSSRRYAYLLHLLLLLAVVSLSLFGLSYCLAITRHRQRKNSAASNLKTVLQHEPLKLVRPEDLTKLSLMEEEETQAGPLPNKQDLALTHANV